MSLSLEQLKEDVASGKIDTVVVGATDMQGRMQGKRIHAPFFIADTIKNGTEGCKTRMDGWELLTNGDSQHGFHFTIIRVASLQLTYYLAKSYFSLRGVNEHDVGRPRARHRRTRDQGRDCR